MTKNEKFVINFEKFMNEQFFEFGGNLQNQEMSLFTEIFVTKVVKIKELQAKNVNIMHLVLNKKFFKIYLSILKFLKEKKMNWFFQYYQGNNFKIEP